MAQQICVGNADGGQTSWTGGYADWSKTSGGSPYISTASDVYESKRFEERMPRAALSTCYFKGASFKNDTDWTLRYGTMLNGSGVEWATDVTVNTFTLTAFQNFALTSTSTQYIDNSQFETAVYHVSGGTAYVAYQYLEYNYTPIPGGFAYMMSLIGAAIGANVLLREMEALASHLYLATTRPVLVNGVYVPTRGGFGLHREDLVPAWRELRAHRWPTVLLPA